MSCEIELKLALPHDALPALRRHLRAAPATRLGNAVTLDNTYYDTPALQLKAHKVAVRIRRQGRRTLQTVKCATLSSGGLSQRPEWEQDHDGAFDFSAVDDPATRRLLERHRDALVPVFTTRFRRETWRHSPREGLAILLMIDTGEVVLSTPEGVERRAPICELELELEQGQPADLLELACALAQDLPLMPADLSKAERGYRLFRDAPPPAPCRSEPSTIAAGDSLIGAFRNLALACVRQWQANATAASAHTSPDEILSECIHQLRVSQRRLRALLKIFAPALPAGFVATWNARLRDNANRFGDARDLDVFCAELLATVRTEGLADADAMALLTRTAENARIDARHRSAHALDIAAQGRLLLEFTLALERLASNSLLEAADLRTFARLRLERLRKRGRRQLDAAATREPAALHALRIGFKQLRYGVEFFAPLFPAKVVKRYQERLACAQTTLGFLQDVDTARARLAQWTAAQPAIAPAAAFVLGWHAPRYTRLRERVIRNCHPLVHGRRPW
ncbi:CYTH and CHAD domain-containing protein [Thauera aromatica]|uniref:Adenylate cyclase n=1 Tax=Thauera aromatica K172 TaxID=44139 RepID=A0A2R4BPJ0_THAAR|nr:CYTH and CHAD domain-containing protein [Thauera aromatica]AVR89249.1 Adenylate cyclase [Thauera aromatica K172]